MQKGEPYEYYGINVPDDENIHSAYLEVGHEEITILMDALDGTGYNTVKYYYFKNTR